MVTQKSFNPGNVISRTVTLGVKWVVDDDSPIVSGINKRCIWQFSYVPKQDLARSLGRPPDEFKMQDQFVLLLNTQLLKQNLLNLAHPIAVIIFRLRLHDDAVRVDTGKLN